MFSIVQITDTHVVQKERYWRGDKRAKTSERLEAVVRDINNLKNQPDIIIHTGDMVDDGEVNSYHKIKEILDQLKARYFLICGNHDNYQNLKRVFSTHNYLSNKTFSNFSIHLKDLDLLCLDTTVSSEEYGKICDTRQRWIEKELKKTVNPVMIFLLIPKKKRVLGFFCGHYHHFEKSVFLEKLCWISPSVAPAHILNTKGEVVLNYTPPRYSIHKIFPLEVKSVIREIKEY